MKLEGPLARPAGVIGSATIAAHRDWIRICAWAVALGLMLAALLLRGGLVARAMGSAWPPFLTLAGVIAAGLVLDRVGVFRLLARLVIPAAASDRLATVGALCFTALLSGLVNLDVAVIVGLPVTLAVARERQLSPARITVAAALTANATSFLLPTSNLTTLLVLDHTPHPALAYAQQSWVAWLLVTALTVGILSAFINHGGNATSRSSAVPVAAPPATLIAAALALLDLVPLFAGAAAIRALLDGGIYPARRAARPTRDGERPCRWRQQSPRRSRHRRPRRPLRLGGRARPGHRPQSPAHRFSGEPRSRGGSLETITPDSEPAHLASSAQQCSPSR